MRGRQVTEDAVVSSDYLRRISGPFGQERLLFFQLSSLQRNLPRSAWKEILRWRIKPITSRNGTN